MEGDFACWMRKRASEKTAFESLSSIRVSATCVEMRVGGFTWLFIGYWNDFWQRRSVAGSQSNNSSFDVFGSHPNCEVEVFAGHDDRRRSSGVRFPTAEGTHRAGHYLVQKFIAHLLFPEEQGTNREREGETMRRIGETESLGAAFVKVRDNLSSGNDLSELLDAMYEFGTQVTDRRRNLLAATVASGLRQSSERRLKRMETFPSVVCAKLSKLSETRDEALQLNFAPRLCRLLST